MSAARRPLLTAVAAGTLLGALWFVPSANASQDAPTRPQATAQVTQQARAASSAMTDGTATRVSTSSTGSTGSTDDGTRLADTGSFDTTPYVVGGTALLAVGAGFVVYSFRRERLDL